MVDETKDPEVLPPEGEPQSSETSMAVATVAPPTSLVSGARGTALPAIATMTDDAFERLIEEGKALRVRLVRVHQEVMKEGVDYGVIPGTKKNTLLKPGAEILFKLNRCAAVFESICTYGDGARMPHITWDSICYALDESGATVAQGGASCNSFEVKYRWRAGARVCPECNEPHVNESNFDDEYYCWKKKGGCGATFALDDDRIKSQSLERQENPDPFEQANTIKKICEKRAMVAAALYLSAASGSFTQDMEEAMTGDVPRADSPEDGDPGAGFEHAPPLSDRSPEQGNLPPKGGQGKKTTRKKAGAKKPDSRSNGGGRAASEKQTRMLKARCYGKAAELSGEEGNHKMAQAIGQTARKELMLEGDSQVPAGSVNGLLGAIERCIYDNELDDGFTVHIPEGDI